MDKNKTIKKRQWRQGKVSVTDGVQLWFARGRGRRFSGDGSENGLASEGEHGGCGFPDPMVAVEESDFFKTKKEESFMKMG